MADIELPQLGESVTEGTITRWFKAVGDQVAEDEPLFEVSTDKVDSEVPSPVSGYLAEILVEEGDTVDVGTRLAVVSAEAPSGGDAATAAADAAPAPEPAAAEAAEPAPEPEPEAEEPTPAEAGADPAEAETPPEPVPSTASAAPSPAP
ncbi:MAG: dihydrolipoamide acyltransferase, partial [Acidimicrobiales bacterium]|nr:dihydrolipoamide acyltransferase [Acidimicrobiales bacterium]